MADFASMLKYLREREKLSQRDLAEKLGISKSTISMYETGNRQPKFEDEEAIADFFNVDLNTLRGKRTPEEQLLDIYIKNSEDQRILDLYHNATPEARTAVDLLLKASQPKPELPHLH